MRSVKEILAEFAGADPNPDDFAEGIIRQLETNGYRIVPVNRIAELEGRLDSAAERLRGEDN